MPDTTSVHSLDAMLREAVLLHREQERRRRHPAQLHVGVPGQHTETYTEHDPGDHGLRTDLVAAMLQRTAIISATRIAWLTRAGGLHPHDADARWASAIRCASAEADLPLHFVVVTRAGWYAPLTGAQRSWVRLRRTSIAPPAQRSPADDCPSHLS